MYSHSFSLWRLDDDEPMRVTLSNTLVVFCNGLKGTTRFISSDWPSSGALISATPSNCTSFSPNGCNPTARRMHEDDEEGIGTSNEHASSDQTQPQEEVMFPSSSSTDSSSITG